VNNGSWCPICSKRKNTKSDLVIKVRRPKKPQGYLNNLENCKNEAPKYLTKNDWQKNNPLSYRWTIKNNLSEEFIKHDYISQ